MDAHDVLGRLCAGSTLGEEEAYHAFGLLLGGELDDAQIGGLLALIQARGATVDELVGAARVMREKAAAVTPDGAPEGTVVLDTCGTGGAPKTFNISTASAIVTAAAGRGRILVAKHGNRSRSGRGSAEVLSELGVNVDAPPAVQGRCLGEAHVCFCFAIHHHPAARHAAGARRSLGFPTIFNVLGPLTNPAGAPRQLMGIYHADLVEPQARALARLGAERAMVVHGRDGMDEVSTTGPTIVGRVEGGTVTMDEIDAADYGLPRATLDDLQVPDLRSAADVVRGVLEGERGPKRDAVVANSAAALLICDACDTMEAGIERAEAAIDSGDALRTLGRLAELSQASENGAG
ncbi:MAG: anthranilate phosphoribosyltransferase [Planctomycetota bacterium]